MAEAKPGDGRTSANAPSSTPRPYRADLAALRHDLNVLHEELERCVYIYSRFLQMVTREAGQSDHLRQFVQAEADISKVVAQLMQKSVLTGRQIESVLTFIAALRSKTSLEPIGYNDASSESAHFLAMIVFSRTEEMWQRCLATAHRSRTEAHYTYQTTATHLFDKVVIGKMRDKPQDLLAMLSLEYSAAVRELDLLEGSSAQNVTINASNVAVSGEKVTVAATPTKVPTSEVVETESGGQHFPTPPEARWADLFIRFTDGHTLLARIRDITRTLNYTQMGMNDGRSGKPNKQWELLRTFAEGCGTLTWRDPASSSKNQKHKELLSAKLRTYFGLPGDPFEVSEGDWLTRFTIEPER